MTSCCCVRQKRGESSVIELRDDQNYAINMLRASIANGHRRIVMKAPTGFGKTVLSGQIVANARSKGKRVLFTVPKITLIDQTIERFARQGIDEVGVIQAQHEMTDWSQPVQVASVATLKNRTIPQADIVLIDECHIWYKFYEKWFLDPAWMNIPIIGLSATPWTKGLGGKGYYTDLIVASTTQELIDAGHLSQFRVFAPSHPDLSDVRTVAGDYVEDELAHVMSDKVLVADIVNTWIEKARGRATLCFAVNRDHAQTLVERFQDAGVRVGYQDAFTNKDERRKLEEDFRTGRIEVAVSIGTLTTGIDWPVDCIVLARPTKSEMLFVQMIGRGLRTAPGKDYCLILDHTDTHLRMGFVTDVDAKHTGLHDGKTKTGIDKNIEEKIRLPKECPSCGSLKAPGVRICLNCGHAAEHVVSIEEKLKEGEGELAELKKKNVSKQYSMEDKASFFAQLRGYCVRHGKNPGFAAHKFREKFGVWPDHSIAKVTPTEPGTEVLSWVKSRQIAWAKSKRNLAA